MGSDAISRWVVSELISIVGHSAGVIEVLCVGKNPTFGVRSVRGDVFCVSSKSNAQAKDWVVFF